MSKDRYPHARSTRWIFIRLLDFFLDFFKIFCRRKNVPTPIRNILVIRLDHIGDVVSSLSILPILKTRFPEARLTVLVGVEGSALLKHNPAVDRVIEFRRNWFRRGASVDWGELFEVARKLRGIKFDLGYDLRGDARNILLMTFSGVRFRVGYGVGGGGSLLHREPVYDFHAHQVVLNRNLVTNEPIQAADLKPRIYVMESEREAARKRFKDAGVPERSFVIAVHPEAGYSSKEWGVSRYGELVERLAEDPANQIILLGTGRGAREVSKARPGRVANFAGALSLRELIGVLSETKLFIGNDSGPSHIAQALRIPVIVLASGTNEYEKWGVWLEPSRILRRTVPCSPCHLKECNVEGHPCMSGISVDEVLEAVRNLSGKAAA